MAQTKFYISFILTSCQDSCYFQISHLFITLSSFEQLLNVPLFGHWKNRIRELKNLLFEYTFWTSTFVFSVEAILRGCYLVNNLSQESNVYDLQPISHKLVQFNRRAYYAQINFDNRHLSCKHWEEIQHDLTTGQHVSDGILSKD
jgi:hypothetical protein